MVEKGGNPESNVDQSKSSVQNDPALDPHSLNADDLNEFEIDSKCKEGKTTQHSLEGADDGAAEGQN